MKKKSETKKAMKHAQRLLEAIEKHAKHALKQGIPRALYVQSVADHAAVTYDRLAGKSRDDDAAG